jgi:hypothetical protein
MTMPDTTQATLSLQSSSTWQHYFTKNAASLLPIPWDCSYRLSECEYGAVIPSIQEFQLGESSEGKHLYHAAQQYARRVGDPDYVFAIAAFIREEQRHARDLKHFLASQQAPAITASWVDVIFRGLRCGTNLELALSVLVTAEILAKVYYAALYTATQSPVLYALCKQILHDEAAHVQFHIERLAHIRADRPWPFQHCTLLLHQLLFCGACTVVWSKHSQVFQHIRMNFSMYWQQCWQEFAGAMHELQQATYRSRLPQSEA